MKSILPLGYGPSTSVDVALSTGERTGGHFAALPIDLVQALIYFIIAKAMEAFVDVSEAMAQAIFSSGYGVTGSVSQVARSASQAILSTVGLDNRTQNMIQGIKQKMSKDRTKIEAKDKQSEQSDKKEDSSKTTRNSKGNPDETIRSDSSDKAKNKEGNGEG